MNSIEKDICPFCPSNVPIGNLKHHQYSYHQDLCFGCYWCKKNQNFNEESVFQCYEVGKMYLMFNQIKFIEFDFKFILKSIYNLFIINFKI